MRKKLSLVIIASLSLLSCATNSSSTIDGNNDYSSKDQDSPNVGSRAYSGAEFPAENSLKPTASGPGITTDQ